MLLCTPYDYLGIRCQVFSLVVYCSDEYLVFEVHIARANLAKLLILLLWF